MGRWIDVSARTANRSWMRFQRSLSAKETIKRHELEEPKPALEMGKVMQSHAVKINRLTKVSLCLDCIVLVILPMVKRGAAEPRKRKQAPPPLRSGYPPGRQCYFAKRRSALGRTTPSTWFKGTRGLQCNSRGDTGKGVFRRLVLQSQLLCERGSWKVEASGSLPPRPKSQSMT